MDEHVIEVVKGLMAAIVHAQVNLDSYDDALSLIEEAFQGMEDISITAQSILDMLETVKREMQ